MIPTRRKKSGGIQKGYVYPKTLEFRQRCDENGFIIVEEYIKLYKETKDPEKKLYILREMARYCYPIPIDHAPKEKESDDEGNENEEHSIRDILDAIDVTPKK